MTLKLIVLGLLLPTVQPAKNHTLYILALASYPDSKIRPSWDGGASLTPAARVAVDEINNSSVILPGYRLELIDRDDGCDVTFKAIDSFVESMFYSGKQVVGMVGPGCSEATFAVSELSRQDSIATLMMSVGTSLKLIDRGAYPYTLRSVGTTLVYVDTYFDLMVRNNWKNVAVLFDNHRTYFSITFDKFRDRFANRVQNGNITFIGGVTATYFPLDALKESHKSRVILGFLGGAVTPQVLCLAYRKGIYYPDYQWVFHDRSVHEFANGIAFDLVDPVCPEGRCSCTARELQVTLNNAIFVHFKLQREDSDNTTLISGKNFTTFFNTYSNAVLKFIAERRMPYPIDLLYGPVYYDAVWSLARALDRAVKMDNVSLEDYWPVRGTSQLRTTRTILSRFFDEDFAFEGASGRIRLSSATGDTSTLVEVFQASKNDSSSQASVILIGKYDGTTLSLTGGTFIPDRFQTFLVTLNIYAAVTFVSLLVVALALTVGLHVITILYRSSAAIKATSPLLNHVIFTGCYVNVAATIIFIVLVSFRTVPPSDEMQRNLSFLCNAFWWLLVLGFTVILGMMVGRLWRIYRIFLHFQDPGNFLSNYHLIGFVLLLVCVDVVFLSVWAGTDHLTYKRINIFFSTALNTNSEYWECNCEHFAVWIALIFAFLGVILGAVVTLAFLNRHVTNANFKYTKSTSALAYVLGTLLCMTVPLYAFFQRDPSKVSLAQGSLCVALVGSVYLFDVFIFFPPIVLLYKDKHRLHNKYAFHVARKNTITSL